MVKEFIHHTASDSELFRVTGDVVVDVFTYFPDLNDDPRFILGPGKNTLRFGALMGGYRSDVTDSANYAYLYNHPGALVSLHKDIIMFGHDFSPVSGNGFSIKLTNESQARWDSWLPTAPLVGDAKPGLLNLSFVIRLKDNSQSYRLRAELFDVTWYPGRWTNDYEVNPSKPDPSLHDNAGKVISPEQMEDSHRWSPTQSFRWAPDSVNADLRLEKSYKYNKSIIALNPNWRFRFERSLNENDRPCGWEEAEYIKPIENDTIVQLTLSSYDFAAGGNLSMGLAKWNGDNVHWQHFTPQKFVAINDTDSLGFIPLPKDMDLVYYTFHDTVYHHDKPEPDSVQVLVQLGDRIGDSWELRPEYDYGNIQNCDPYKDDSIVDSSYFPTMQTDSIETPDSIRSFGDGLMNLEKYRGVYGVRKLDGTDDYLRIYPRDRNIFCISMEDMLMKQEHVFALHDSIENFNSIASVKHDTSMMMLVHNMNDKGEGIKAVTYDNIGLYDNINDEYRRYGSMPYMMGVLRLNGRLIGLPDQKIAPVVWCMNYTKVPNRLRAFRADRNDTEFVGGRTEHPMPDSVVYPCPQHVSYCHTYFENLKLIAWKGIPANPDGRDRFLHEAQFVSQGHEMGHLVSLRHDDNDSTGTIMYGKLRMDHYFGTFKSGVAFKRRDLVRLRLTN